MPMEMIFPHPSAIQENKFFQLTIDRGQTRFTERVHLPSLLLSVRWEKHRRYLSMLEILQQMISNQYRLLSTHRNCSKTCDKVIILALPEMRLITEQQTLSPQMDKSILENGHADKKKIPKICSNDELISTSPSAVPVKLNNVEKLDSEGLMEKTTLPQTSSSWNIADVNKITNRVQSIKLNWRT